MRSRRYLPLPPPEGGGGAEAGADAGEPGPHQRQDRRAGAAGGTLRAQSEKAKKYLIFRDELRGLEISVWLDTLERIRVSTIKLETDYKEAVRQKEEPSGP